MKAFMDQNFLLETPTAQKLFHEYASQVPVLDYHCHINPQEIAEDDEHHGEVDGKIDEVDRERRGVQAEQGGGILDEIAEQEQIERQVAPAGDGCRAAEAVAEGGFFRHGSLLRASV